MKLACLLLLALAGEARADLRTAIGNDILAAGDAGDDDGFTNDIDVRFWRPHGGYLIGGELYDRWVTEEPRVAGRRRDLVELVATAERGWERGLVQLVVAGRGGPVFTGNLAGRWMQNAFHTTCRCGDSLDEGLQHIYEDSRDAGLVVGTRARASIGVPVARAYAALDDQLALGTGVSFIDAAGGAAVAWRATPSLELGGHVELAAVRFAVADDALAMPGGYRPGWRAAVRFGVHVAHGRFRVEYQHRSNEGGSGSPIGVVAVTVKQAGGRF